MFAVDLVLLACADCASKLYAIHHAAGQAELTELKGQSVTVPAPRLHRLYVLLMKAKSGGG